MTSLPEHRLNEAGAPILAPASSGYAADLFQRIHFGGQPVANPGSTIVSGDARFTVLTPRLIRLEWSEVGTFEDRGTYAFPTRRGPVPDFEVQLEKGVLTLDTGRLVLRHEQGADRLAAGNLSISFDLDSRTQTWTPGMPNPANLRGTRRTLDECHGDAALEEGIISRAGWALFDDSAHAVFEDGWPAPRPDHALQDWYFFGHGHDYTGALAEYTRFGGPIPLIPRYALGVWWSRYWAYSERDLKRLVRDFGKHDIPLDVLVLDMDWHTPRGWTGYTWNRDLFPNPPAFLKWLHDHGLRTALNLHPAEGVQPFEEMYPRVAEAVGVGPGSGEPVQFRITDRRFVQAYFELLHHSLEEMGVDFWWMDWQQGETTEIEGLDPLPWLNHIHFRDATRRGERPMLHSRWGGLGNHRYPIGFSGDTFVTWSALQFQPYFTATASNVGYGWWSHDIGGHMGGATEPELYARWVQFGALSPCLRLHATKDARAERRPWKYPQDVYQAAQEAFHWRYRLLPYTYTMARVASDTGVSLCRPMYYQYPESKDAYAARYQYLFGDQMIAAPIVHPADPETGVASADVWVPDGTWIDYQTKETFTGPCWTRLVGGIERMPMLVKAGAILTLAPLAETTEDVPRDRLIITVFPAASGRFRLYEDDGKTDSYRQGQCEWTELTTWLDGEDTWIVNIAAVEGRCAALPNRRRYELWLEGSNEPHKVTINGTETSDWTYEAETLTTTVHVPEHRKQESITVVISAQDTISALGQAHNREVAFSDVRRLLGSHCPENPGNIDAVVMADVPGRLDAIARLRGPFVRFMAFTAPEEAAQHLGRVIIGAPDCMGKPYDVEAIFTLYRNGKARQYKAIQFKQAMAPTIIDVPLVFDGQVRCVRWRARVTVNWRGTKLFHEYHGGPLFPTVYAWRALVGRQDGRRKALEDVLDDHGHIDATLDWQDHSQRVDGLRSVDEPHIVAFDRIETYRAELQAGTPLAAYLATTVISPDEREACIEFHAQGRAVLYLNGQALEPLPKETRQTDGPPLFRPTLRTAQVSLREGRNSLVVDTRPSEEKEHRWRFGAAFRAPDGKRMCDLAFE